MGTPQSTVRIIVCDITFLFLIMVLLWISSPTQQHTHRPASPPSINPASQTSESEESKWPEIVTNLLIGLASAGAAVLGVIMSNSHSRVIMKEQREAEFATQERNRYLSYKKEVYFQVADDLGQLHMLFARLGDAEFDEKDFTEASSRSMSGLHKLNLLAGPDTLTASHAAVVALSGCLSDVTPLRLTIRILKSKMANADSRIRQLSKEIEGKLAELKGVESEEGRSLLAPNVRELIDEQAVVIGDLSQLGAERQRHVWELSARCIAHGVTLQGFINSLVIAMRLEIGVPVDADRYVAESKEAGAAVSKSQMELSEKVQALVKEMIERPY